MFVIIFYLTFAGAFIVNIEVLAGKSMSSIGVYFYRCYMNYKRGVTSVLFFDLSQSIEFKRVGNRFRIFQLSLYLF